MNKSTNTTIYMHFSNFHHMLRLRPQAEAGLLVAAPVAADDLFIPLAALHT